MANLSPVAANLRVGEGATVKLVQAGAAVSRWSPVYKSSSTGRHLDAINTSEDAAKCEGIALTDADANGDWFLIITKGPLISSASLFTAGTGYQVSSTAGLIAEEGDATSGQFVSKLGVAASATQLDVNRNNTGTSV